jgi:hypothetical protein
MSHSHLFLEAPFGFSLAAAAEFYAGFAPMGGAARQSNGTLELAFLADRTFELVRHRGQVVLEHVVGIARGFRPQEGVAPVPVTPTTGICPSTAATASPCAWRAASCWAPFRRPSTAGG